MNKLFLNKLNNDELKVVFNNNAGLRSILLNRAIENTNYWINEYFSIFPNNCINYEYGADCNCWINVCNTLDFIDGVRELKRIFGFDNIDNALLDRLHDRCEYRDACDDGWHIISDKNYNSLENWIDRTSQNIADYIANVIQSEYNAVFNNNYLFDMFTNYIDEYNDFYIDNNGVLWQVMNDRKIS